MNSPVTIENQVWLKAALVFGLIAFGAATVFCVTFALWLAPSIQASVVMAGLGLLFGGLSFAGWPLVRYLNHKLQLTDEGIVINSAHQHQSYLWQSLKFRVRKNLQIIEIRERDGNLLYAVDFMAKNTHPLMQRIGAVDA
ncbi:hypothetical protein [Solimonas marina]|uniref:PH domain-containing protein n=1 Tax=Solimonas marina TaxID=2714601 RepID=A0A969WBB3_9GAMM|nr:hypothetical protein [Solimonas marina]NKF23398.1 hypothetical protein [Solimonas marina]